MSPSTCTPDTQRHDPMLFVTLAKRLGTGSFGEPQAPPEYSCSYDPDVVLLVFMRRTNQEFSRTCSESTRDHHSVTAQKQHVKDSVPPSTSLCVNTQIRAKNKSCEQRHRETCKVDFQAQRRQAASVRVVQANNHATHCFLRLTSLATPQSPCLVLKEP